MLDGRSTEARASAPDTSALQRCVVLALTLLASCGDQPSSVVELGVLETRSEALMVEVPARGAVGASIPVKVVTYGDGCVRQGATDTQSEADVVVITPYDRRYLPMEGEGCTLGLQLISHAVDVAFSTPGAKTITVHGRRLDYPADDEIDRSFALMVE